MVASVTVVTGWCLEMTTVTAGDGGTTAGNSGQRGRGGYAVPAAQYWDPPAGTAPVSRHRRGARPGTSSPVPWALVPKVGTWYLTQTANTGVIIIIQVRGLGFRDSSSRRQAAREKFSH